MSEDYIKGRNDAVDYIDQNTFIASKRILEIFEEARDCNNLAINAKSSNNSNP